MFILCFAVYFMIFCHLNRLCSTVWVPV